MSMIINPYVFAAAGGGGGVPIDNFGRLYEQFYSPGRAQEPGSTLSLNLANPITGGLVFSTFPGGARWNDLVNGGRGTVDSIVKWFNSAHELRYGYGKDSGDPGNAYYPWAPLIGSITTQCSIMVHLAISAMVNFSELLCIPYRNDGTWTAPFGAMEFVRNGTNSSVNFTYANAGSQVAVTSDTGYLVADDTTRMYVVTRDGATVTFYKDGFKFGATKTLGSNGNTDFNGGNPVVLGNRSPSSPGNPMGGTYSQAAMWNRVLNPSEIAMLYLRPLLLLKPPF